MKFGSVCSGIESASVAWEPLGLSPAWFAEIEPFPSAVLSQRFPKVPNLGDMTLIDADDSAVNQIDVLVGGTPCQAFSIAGLRKSLDDERGNLSLAFCRLARRIAEFGRLRTVVWENVPGVLSTNDNAFGCFLAGLVGESVPLVPGDGTGRRWSHAGCVYGPEGSAAWRVLDAQYVGLAQRRKRVFVVFCVGNWTDPARLLFEWDGVRRDSPPSRNAGEKVAGTIASRASGGGGLGTDFDCDGGAVACTLPASDGGVSSGMHPIVMQERMESANPNAGPGGKGWSDEGIAFTLEARHRPQTVCTPIDMRQASRGEKMTNNRREGSSGGPPGTGIGEPGDPCPALSTSHPPAVAYRTAGDGAVYTEGDMSAPLTTITDKSSHIVQQRMGVRRLMPVECERLQGFPDGWTLVTYRGKPAADSPRYKAIGNSMATRVMRWIGKRILAAMTAA